MLKRVFISSVQSEFAEERKRLFDYLRQDALFGQFFEPFLFENLPAIDQSPQKAYLEQAANCDIYIGLLGTQYGYEDAQGVSPTEREYDAATQNYAYRLVYLLRTDKARHPKETALIRKAEQDVVRRSFVDFDELRAAVYASLVRYLEEKELIRHTPFDATINRNATIDDLDSEKIRIFVNRAKAKRQFNVSFEDGIENVLSALNLINDGKITNAALLLFGKQPQSFFITSQVKCAQFYGTQVEKPIKNYQIYRGTVFELIDQAVSFVMSRIDAQVGTRDKSVDVPVDYELPERAVTEAIVNAIAHRDYSSNQSVQVMLFRDRLEVWNPGHLPYGLTTARLRELHPSDPTNPTLAYPMYLAGSIEHLGTGTTDLIEACVVKGLRAPEFIQQEDFRTIIYRPIIDESDLKSDLKTSQKTSQKSDLKSDLKSDPQNGRISLTMRQKQILIILRRNTDVTIPILMQKTSLGRTSVKKYLKELQDLKLVRFIGPDKGGHWETIKTK